MPTKVDKKKTPVSELSPLEFVPIVADVENGLFENADLLPDLLKMYEVYYPFFADDLYPGPDDYDAWLNHSLGFVNACYPWFFGVKRDGQLDGVLWADFWEGPPDNLYTCKVSGFTRRGVPPVYSKMAFKTLVDKIFESTPVYIVRTCTAQNNKAAQRCTKSIGFSHPEPVRAWKMQEGQEITGIISSITRPEWSAHVEEIERK